MPLGGGPFDLLATAAKLGMAVVHDTDDLWAIGPETLGGRALVSATAPELSLPDIRSGEVFHLSSLRGRKVVLAAWAAY